MAKAKTTPKKSSKKPTKYSKLLVVAQKELATKKKALVSAERALAKAKQKHEELIAEVARLDMVERSLKAVVEGTEPPTNVKYVYNYPQWVWYPQYQYVYHYTAPAPNTGYGYPSWSYTNSGTANLNTLQDGHSITCQNSVLTTTASGLTGTYQNAGALSDSGITFGPSADLGTLCNNVSLSASSSLTAGDGLVVDLSTGAEPSDASQAPAEAIVAAE